MSLVFGASAQAAGLPDLGGHVSGLFAGGDTTSTSSIQTFILNAGLTYAKSDPKYAAISALGINDSNDLQNFLNGDQNGSNFQDIIVHAAFQYAQGNPLHADWLAKVGVTDEASLKTFLNGKGAKNQDTIFNLALDYAENNPQYAAWLDQLGIQNISDISDIMNGDLDTSNLKDILSSLGTSFLQANPKDSHYAYFLSLLTGDSTLHTSDLSDIFLGAYDGLPVSEIKLIQTTKKIKAKNEFEKEDLSTENFLPGSFETI